MRRGKPFILCFVANPLGWRTPGLYGGGEKITKDFISDSKGYNFRVVISNNDFYKNQDHIFKELIKLPFLKTYNILGDIINFLYWSIFILFRLKKITNEIDLIYSPTTNISDFLPSYIAAKIFRKKIITKLHISIYNGKQNVLRNIYSNYRNESNNLIDSLIRTLSAYFVYLLLSKVDLIICTSNYVAKSLNNLPVKTAVNINGIQIQGLMGKKRDIDFCFMSRVEKYKGIYSFLEIVKKIDKSFSVIIGAGTESKQVEKTIKKYGLSKRVKFLGFLADRRFEYLQRSKIFLFPTVGSEGQSLVITEAISRGVVVITYRTRLYEEIYSKLRSVILVDNIDEMYNVASSLFNKPKLVNELSKYAILESKEFSIDKFFERERKIINEVF